MIYSAFDSLINVFLNLYGWSISHMADNILFVPLAFIISFCFIFLFLIFAFVFSIVMFGVPLFLMYKTYKQIIKIFCFIAEESAYFRYTLKENVKKMF